MKKCVSRCAICKTNDPKGIGNRFHVDHDHDTGKVRGLLCWTCNRRLGVVEKREWLDSALDYLGIRKQ